jgi:uncharacterized protein (DUF2267 family)
MTQPCDVVHASKLYPEWLASLKDRSMLQTHNHAQAIFRSVFHCLRDRLSSSQVLSFADALPPLPPGIFIEGWRPVDPRPHFLRPAVFRKK